MVELICMGGSHRGKMILPTAEKLRRIYSGANLMPERRTIFAGEAVYQIVGAVQSQTCNGRLGKAI
jgi:hypothetical protein